MLHRDSDFYTYRNSTHDSISVPEVLQLLYNCELILCFVLYHPTDSFHFSRTPDVFSLPGRILDSPLQGNFSTVNLSIFLDISCYSQDNSVVYVTPLFPYIHILLTPLHTFGFWYLILLYQTFVLFFSFGYLPLRIYGTTSRSWNSTSPVSLTTSQPSRLKITGKMVNGQPFPFPTKRRDRGRNIWRPMTNPNMTLRQESDRVRISLRSKTGTFVVHFLDFYNPLSSSLT